MSTLCCCSSYHLAINPARTTPKSFECGELSKMGQHVQSSIKLNENTSVEPMACCLDNVKPLPSAPRASANSNHWPRTLQHLNSGTRGTRRLMALSSAVLRKYAHLLGAIPKEAFVFNRHTVATAALIGLFIGMLPIPMQMLVAAAAALLFRAYLPVAVCAVWVDHRVCYACLSVTKIRHHIFGVLSLRSCAFIVVPYLSNSHQG